MLQKFWGKEIQAFSFFTKINDKGGCTKDECHSCGLSTLVAQKNWRKVDCVNYQEKLAELEEKAALRKRKNIEPAPSLREVYDELKTNNVPSELIPNPPLRRPQLVAARRKRRRMDDEAQNEALKSWKSLKSSHS